jgi:cytochrome b
MALARLPMHFCLHAGQHAVCNLHWIAILIVLTLNRERFDGMKKVRIWDLPTRLFHWALAICVATLFVTGKIGGGAMDWHFRTGYAVASLLLFRLAWGVFGGRWSRFGAFIHGPRSIMAYLRGQSPPDHAIGHNPLGAVSIFAMLFLLLAQVSTGLFSEDKGEAFGPLSLFVSRATVHWVTGYHKNVGQLVLMMLVLLHLAAVAAYHLVQKNNLVMPMIAGDKWLPDQVPPSRDDAASRLLALILLAACALAVRWIVGLGAGMENG